MKKAIEFLRSKSITVSDDGIILSELPYGEDGISLIDELEENTEDGDYCYTLIDNRLFKIDI